VTFIVQDPIVALFLVTYSNRSSLRISPLSGASEFNAPGPIRPRGSTNKTQRESCVHQTRLQKPWWAQPTLRPWFFLAACPSPCSRGALRKEPRARHMSNPQSTQTVIDEEQKQSVEICVVCG